MASEPANPALAGTFHMAAQGDAVWADVAEATFAASQEQGGPSARVRRITTAAYPPPAWRPAHSRRDATKLARVYGLALPEWRVSLEATVDRLLREAHAAG